MLGGLGDSLIAVLPPDLERQVTDIRQKGSGGDESPPAEGPAEEGAGNDAAPVNPDEATDLEEDGSPPAEDGAQI